MGAMRPLVSDVSTSFNWAVGDAEGLNAGVGNSTCVVVEVLVITEPDPDVPSGRGEDTALVDDEVVAADGSLDVVEDNDADEIDE